jgi:hypothetical protein
LGCGVEISIKAMVAFEGKLIPRKKGLGIISGQIKIGIH